VKIKILTQYKKVLLLAVSLPQRRRTRHTGGIRRISQQVTFSDIFNVIVIFIVIFPSAGVRGPQAASVCLT
jgi:hypothetical protein